MRLTTFLLISFIAIGPKLGHAQSIDSLHLLWRHQQIRYASAFGISHSGKTLAVVEYPQIKLWDLSTNTFMRAFRIPARAYDQLAFSAEDKEVVLLKTDTRAYGTEEEYVDPPSSILRLNIESGTYSTIPVESRERGKWSLSPDGERIAMLSGNTLTVLNSRLNTVVSSAELPLHHAQWPDVAEVSFADQGNKIFVFWYGEARLCDTHSPEKQQILADSITWHAPKPSIDGVYLPASNDGREGSVVAIRTGKPAELQPLPLDMPVGNRGRGRRKDERSEVADATLFGDGEYLATRYVLWRGIVYDYGTPPGEDSIVFTSRHDPGMHWSILASNGLRVIGHVLNQAPALLCIDNNTVFTIDVKTKQITYLTTHVDDLIGFSANDQILIESASTLTALDPKTGNGLWTQPGMARRAMLSPGGNKLAAYTADKRMVLLDVDRRDRRDFGPAPDRGYIAAYLDDGALLLKTDYTGSTRLLASSGNEKLEKPLDPYLRYIPFGKNTLIAYGNFWSLGDSAVLYDYSSDNLLRAYVGGLNNSINSAAVSHDKKWLVTIAPGGIGKLWRISDGALKKCFGLQGRSSVYDIEFTPNDRWIVYERDTSFFAYDLLTDHTSLVMPTTGRSTFTFSRDGSTFAIANDMFGLSAYEVPSIWRDSMKLDPKQNFLVLRWYLPSGARDAIDTNGKPFVPARTDAKVELRYSDGRLLKKIVNGPYHKGKWHEWEVDMTDHPPGKYILHTEIGGVVRDEELELK